MLLKLFLIILFCTQIIHSFGQKNENYSLEVDGNYYYYPLVDNQKNYFNDGYSLLASYIVDKFKYSSGINFSTKDYYLNFIPNINNNLTKQDFMIQYINIPVLISYTVFSSMKYKADILCGVIFNRIIRYDIASYYSNKDPFIENNVEINKKSGKSVSLGFGISRYINQHLLLSISPFTNFKIETEKGNYRPNYHNPPNDRLSFGLKLGFEYLLD